MAGRPAVAGLALGQAYGNVGCVLVGLEVCGCHAARAWTVDGGLAHVHVDITVNSRDRTVTKHLEWSSNVSTTLV